jgi:ubiquinone/menaquinone biosynthesis C-methylase UbiE
MSSSTETFQISAEQAEVYETKFVPAIFAQWAPLLLDATGVKAGQTVMDVACGTGILARTAADRVGVAGKVVGLDLSEGMLTVARRVRPDLEWRQGDAATVPFPDDTFDAVLCQSSMMFFPDATGALREMARVCKPAGNVGVQVYSSLQAQPAYGPWINMVAQHADPDAVDLLSTYWVHGDLDVLRRRFEAAGLDVTAINTITGTARFGSIEEMVRTEVESTPLVDRISDEVYRRILQESSRVLGEFETDSGAEVPIEGCLVIGRKP